MFIHTKHMITKHKSFLFYKKPCVANLATSRSIYRRSLCLWHSRNIHRCQLHQQIFLPMSTEWICFLSLTQTSDQVRDETRQNSQRSHESIRSDLSVFVLKGRHECSPSDINTCFLLLFICLRCLTYCQKNLPRIYIGWPSGRFF